MDAILVSISIVIHRVKQRLLRNYSASANCDLLRPLARKSFFFFKGQLLVQTNFDELPNTEEEEKVITWLLKKTTQRQKGRLRLLTPTAVVEYIS